MLLLLTALACAPTTTPPEPAADPGEPAQWGLIDEGALFGDLRAHTYEYDNGLRLIVVPDHAAPVVAYQTWYGVGSSDEELNKTGLAHLFEHMMFKDTTEYDANHYDATLGELGASGLNAWTWLDETVYIQSVPTAALPTLAELESTRMTQLLLDAERLDSEREVVINERRLRVDNEPDGRLNEQLYATAFERHTYGWPTIGWLADLEAMTVEDAEAFYRRWYAPDNATIVLAGDVTPDDAAALIGAHYADLSASGVSAAPLPTEPPQVEQRRLELTLPVSADRIQIGFKAPAATHPDAPALQVLDAILTGGQSALLKRALQDTGLAGSVGGFMTPMQEPGLFELSAVAREGVSAELLEQHLMAELDRVIAEGVSEADVERGVNALRASTWRRMESASGVAGFVGWNLTVGGDWRHGMANLEAIEAVTAEDIQRVAATWLRVERSTVAVGLAEGAEYAEIELGVRPAVTPGPAVTARDVAGPPALADAPAEIAAEGGTLVLAYDPSAPLLRLQIGFPAGSAVDAIPGTAGLAARATLRGTTARDRAQFEQAVERLGASVSVEVDADATVYTAAVLASAWPEFIALLTEALSQPAFAPADVDQLKDELVNQLRESRDRDGALVQRAFLSAWYGDDHPYGRDPRGTEGSLASITPDDLAAHRAAWLRPEGAVIGLSGAFDAEAQADLTALLAALAPAEGAEAPERPEIPAVTAPSERRVLLVDKPDRTQVQVLIGHEGPDWGAADYPAWQMGTEVFGGRGFQTWLMQEVRVARGWSYFANGYDRRLGVGGWWAARLAPGSEYAIDAAQLVLDLMAKANDEGIDGADLDRERAGQLNAAPFLADTPSKRMGIAFDRALRGYDRLAWLDAYPDVAEADAEAALAGGLHPDRALVVLVGTASELQEAAAALGPVEVVSWEDVR